MLLRPTCLPFFIVFLVECGRLDGVRLAPLQSHREKLHRLRGGRDAGLFSHLPTSVPRAPDPLGAKETHRINTKIAVLNHFGPRFKGAA